MQSGVSLPTQQQVHLWLTISVPKTCVVKSMDGTV